MRTPKAPIIHVNVTQDIIDASTKRDSSHCMIAEAIQAAYPDARFVSVDLATIRITNLTKRSRYIYLTPRPAQEALLDFDQGNAVRPFSFRVRAAQIIPAGRRLRPSLTKGNAPQLIPTKVGGVAPPVGPLASATAGSRRTGRVRRFGLRSLAE